MAKNIEIAESAIPVSGVAQAVKVQADFLPEVEKAQEYVKVKEAELADARTAFDRVLCAMNNAPKKLPR